MRSSDLSARELDLLSALLLAFTCRVLWAVRPGTEFKAIADNPQLMVRYFTALEAACKYYIPCYICFKLHLKRYKNTDDKHPTRSKRGRRICEFEAGEV